MIFLGYVSSLAIPFTVLLAVTFGLIKKKNVFDIFLKGAKEGMEIVIKIFPTLIGLFVAIGALRSSGLLDYIIKIISPILDYSHFPKEIMPLAILRPISRKCIFSSWY